MKKKKIIGWVLAVTITLSAAYYQRTTGPTYPKSVTTEINGKAYKFKLDRSHSTSSDCEITIPVNDNEVRGFLIYRPFPTNYKWDTIAMSKTSEGMSGSLPKQLAAGKLEYFLLFRTGEKSFPVLADKPNVIRFKGDVPAYILIPHIICMFFAMMLANLAGLFAAFKIDKARMWAFITFVGLLCGGMILGPIVQKFAFNEFWTGVPYGWDLTDNKTLIAFIAWVIALLANRKKFRPGFIIGAAIVTLAIFSIPHSMFGSQLNHATGAVMTGR